MQRQEGHFDAKGNQDHNQQNLLGARRQLAGVDRQAFKAVGFAQAVEGEEGDKEDNPRYSGVDQEFKGSLVAAPLPPDGNHQVDRHEHQLVANKEEEQIFG